MKWRLQKGSLLFIVTLVIAGLSGCGKPYLSALDPAGEVAREQYDLMMWSVWIMLFVMVVVFTIFVTVLIRFRRKKGDDSIPKQVAGNHKLEILWTIIPIVLLILIAIPTITNVFKLGDTKAMEKKKDGKHSPLVVKVRASLYWWEFEYPDYGVITSQELVVPTDQKIYFQVKASDVKHSFWIPSVGGKLDANTDNVNKFWLEIDHKKAEEAGNVFYGKCAELCGPSHSLMDFRVKAVSQSEFQNWINKMKNAKETKTTTALAQEGLDVFKKSCISCHAVTPNDTRPEQARTAPNLATFGEREKVAGILDHNEQNIKNWIKDPSKYKPGTKMPAFGNKLSDQEVDALAAYLMTLKAGK
ncbi:cytochrome c oxidase subunit 2 [Weizmannia acidilactici]|uniref:Cytochrome c oxidase subunit 2 n=1 Tax=Weizmannia acidilactici TaxID=2607726 RepID=A0A5J4JJB0_9BACI|nr:cytochrome c oxidase subunit II [Weizmannia acidilactici]GER68419.1 cytochrome c oxidase subunit 2 [Weizmannia acidilactici]GER70815.1 cytochrome c oxidase subunit 2 [Weizmannia acidilactici]GER74926.1 cytochrome c oxidase subunit 2 [Weizmannia acidilactici]